MGAITVVITTTGRPHFLRSALQSVQNQIGREHLVQVIVSENKGDPRSESVAREFGDLPIRYLFRKPTLGMLDHIFSTVREARTPLVAILNDDDWWASNHLSEAVAALQATPKASGYASAATFVRDETDGQPRWIDRSAIVWLVAGMPSWLKLWTLDQNAMLGLAWLYTPFHWSTLVARREALENAMTQLEGRECPKYTIDRLVFACLATSGLFCYNPIPETFIRWHQDNLVKSQGRREVQDALNATVARIEELAKARGLDPVQFWKGILSRMPREIESEVLYRFRLEHTAKELKRQGLEIFFHVRLPNPRLAVLRKVASHMKQLVAG